MVVIVERKWSGTEKADEKIEKGAASSTTHWITPASIMMTAHARHEESGDATPDFTNNAYFSIPRAPDRVPV